MPQEASSDEEGLPGAIAFSVGEDPQTGEKRITSFGKGRYAREIRRRALERDIPVTEDPEAIGEIIRFPDDRAIPPVAYELIAEVLDFVFRLNEQFKSEHFEEGGDA